jgi:hypothetical protein
VLGHDPRQRAQKCGRRGSQACQSDFQELRLGVRRIDQDDVERAVRRCSIREVSEGVGGDDGATIPQVGSGQVLGDDATGCGISLYEYGSGCPARQRFDSACAGTGEKVQNRGVGEVRLQDCEQRLLDAIA